MRPEAPAFPASPLTVWVGPTRYVFAPGRDVIVGYGHGCDIPLERLGSVAPPPPTPRPYVVLRFAGTHWVAIDRSPNGIFGIFVSGSPVPTVNIHDGQAITIGDPQRGPRLVFQVGPAGSPRQPPGPSQRPVHPPPPPAPRFPPSRQPAPPITAQPNRLNDPYLQAPTQRATQRMRVAPPPSERRPQLAPPTTPPGAEDERPTGRRLIKRVSDATRKLRAPLPSFRSEAADPTYRLPLRPGARTTGVAAHQLGLTVNGQQLLTDISFTARPGTLTGLIGPSAARNSALLGLLAGTRERSAGITTVDGHDVHAEPESMRSRIGIVPRDDRIDRRLTVEQALQYAAELRLPPDTSSSQRHRVVTQVLEELQLTPHRAARVSKLSPEVRRCASMAIELLTRPTLLVVDEPGAGLDPAQTSHVMAVLRRQADIGCVVVVAMSSSSSPTSLAYLNMCDQVLVLTSAGTMAYAGTPLQVESAMGTADWSSVLAQVSVDPDGAHRAFRARQQPPTSTPPPEVATPWPVPAELPAQRQILLVGRRQLRLLLGEPVYFVFVAFLPFVLAGLTLLIPGDSGLARPGPAGTNVHEAIEILAALNVAAVIMGTALTIRDLAVEQRVFRREQAVGLSASTYLAAKIVVFSAAAAMVTAVSFAVVVIGKGGPAHGAVLLHNATVELYLSVAVTAIVSAIGGLALSTLGSRPREVVPLVVPLILASLLFDGSLVALVGNWGFQQISWLVPAQWGFAASASTVDLRRVDPLAANAAMWTHYSGWWVFDMVVLVGFGAVAAGFTWYRLRPPKREIPGRSAHREQQEPGDLTG